MSEHDTNDDPTDSTAETSHDVDETETENDSDPQRGPGVKRTFLWVVFLGLGITGSVFLLLGLFLTVMGGDFVTVFGLFVTAIGIVILLIVRRIYKLLDRSGTSSSEIDAESNH